jgi:hypothetical protein
MDTELLEAVALGVLVDLLAIVPAVEMGLVRKAVELRSDLAELGDDDLFVRAAHVGEWFMNVRLVWTSKRRVPKNAMLGPSTCASSNTSPVLISFAAFITAAGFW